ncbi:MAG TPA: anti-sigma factor [Longimicrobiales bacterium]|nr:anti-sigma factor [Longimicrobiales bacterium]
MTTHPANGELRAYLDGEAGSEDARRIGRHMEECAPCGVRVSELRSAEADVSRALVALDPAVDIPAARARVRRRLAGAGRGTRRLVGSPLARAALLVLALAGGAAAAIPGSPVRAWLGAAWERIAGDSPAPAPAPDAQEEPAGVRVEPAAGAVRIVLLGAGPGTRIRVRVVESPGAAVFAGPGTRFRSGPGSVEARLQGDEVRVEIPRDALRATVTVNGSVFFRKTAEGVELPGPVQDTVESEFRFRLPGGDPG